MQPSVNAPLKLLNAHSIGALFNGSSHFFSNFWTKCKFKVQIRIILPKQAFAPSLWLSLYCVVVVVESHCNLTSVLELDLKILKTHLSVILVQIKAIFSIYCPLPSAGTFMLFSGCPEPKLLQISGYYIVTLHQEIRISAQI